MKNLRKASRENAASNLAVRRDTAIATVGTSWFPEYQFFRLGKLLAILTLIRWTVKSQILSLAVSSHFQWKQKATARLQSSRESLSTHRRACPKHALSSASWWCLPPSRPSSLSLLWIEQLSALLRGDYRPSRHANKTLLRKSQPVTNFQKSRERLSFFLRNFERNELLLTHIL